MNNQHYVYPKDGLRAAKGVGFALVFSMILWWILYLAWSGL